MVNRLRWINSTLMVELNDSETALSNADPTRPIDCLTPTTRQAVSNTSPVYSPPRSLLSGNPLNSDAGSQYTAVHFGETLMLEGLKPSVGSVGDAYDNALAETTIGLYKTECVRDGSPFRTGPIATLADLEEVTSAWVAWYNHDRLMHRLGRRPPAEAEADYHTTVHVS